MSEIVTFSEWYTRPKSLSSGSKRSIVEEAFQEAKIDFEHESNKDPRRIELTHSKTNFDDVKNSVQDARERYNFARKDSKVRKWLNRLSQRIHFYGGVLDVIAQHHPEYVALAWGSMKFLLTAVINHEKIVTTLAKAITKIADVLPRVGLKSSLYPTGRMREAVKILYIGIFDFFSRARQWYEEHGFMRLVHSITHPVELRYSDLLDKIEDSSRTIDELASSGQQAELRVMHLKFDNMMATVEKISTTVSLNSNALLDTNDRLTDLQFSQIMNSLSKVNIVEPLKSFQYHSSLKRQRSRSAVVQSIPNKFWQSQKLQDWSHAHGSALAIVTGNYQARFVMRDFCIEIIEQVREANIPILFALKVPQEQGTSQSTTISTVDILKYLVRQAIDTRRRYANESSMALRCAIFHDAATEQEWFQLLQTILAELEGQFYIVIDLELLDKLLEPTKRFSWVQQFQAFFENMTARGITIKVKVVLVSCSVLPFQLTESERTNFVVQARTQTVTARQRKFGRARHLQKTPPFRLKGLNKTPNHN